MNRPSFGYIPTLHLLSCKAYLFIDLLTPVSLNMQMATNVDWPPLGPLPLDHTKLTFDLRELGGFAQTLCQVLITLGVPNELVKVTCTGKPAQEGGIEGPIVTSVES